MKRASALIALFVVGSFSSPVAAGGLERGTSSPRPGLGVAVVAISKMGGGTAQVAVNKSEVNVRAAP